MNNVKIEQVEMTKLLGATLDCKLSWSKLIDTTVAKMGRSLSIIMHYFAFLTALSTRQVLQALVLSHLFSPQVPQRGTFAIGSDQVSTAGPWMYMSRPGLSYLCFLYYFG